MKTQRPLIILIVLASVVFSGCNSMVTARDAIAENSAAEMDSQETNIVEMSNETPAGELLAKVTPVGEVMADRGNIDAHSTAAMLESATPEASGMETSTIPTTPDWFDAKLVDASSGESFSLNTLKGKVVLVETLAMWCSNCLKQQKQVVELHALIGEREDFISLGLDIDPNEDAAALRAYIEKHGFDWYYAIAPAEVARDIGKLYGAQFLNPPSTPMLIIDRHGQAHPLPYGIKDAQSLYEALQPFLSESM